MEKRKTDPYLDRRSGDDRREGQELGYFSRYLSKFERRKYMDRRHAQDDRRELK